MDSKIWRCCHVLIFNPIFSAPQLQFYWTVNFDCVRSVFSILPQPQSHNPLQVQYFQCVDFQCFSNLVCSLQLQFHFQCLSNVLCSFISSSIDCEWLIWVYFLNLATTAISQSPPSAIFSMCWFECCKCVVGCQCLSNVLCSFCVSMIIPRDVTCAWYLADLLSVLSLSLFYT